MNKALILAGTNIPPCVEHLSASKEQLIKRGLNIKGESSIYKSPPWGFESQNEFLNQVFRIETTLNPFELMNILLEIEKDLGRERSSSTGYIDRIIDLDILLYNKEVITSDRLNIPHPRMEQRRFALLPAAEIAGKWIHPVSRLSIQELLERCTDKAEVKSL